MPHEESNPLLVIDPRIRSLGVVVDGIRFRRGHVFEDGDTNYTLAARLTRTGTKWPKGQWRVLMYGSDGLLLTHTHVTLLRGLDKNQRHMEANMYAASPHRAELVFEPHDLDADEHDWRGLVLGRDMDSEYELGLTLDGVLCQVRKHFQYDNQLIVRVSGQVLPSIIDAFPSDLAVNVTVFGVGDVVLAGGIAELGSRTSNRVLFEYERAVYDHIEPSRVVVELTGKRR